MADACTEHSPFIGRVFQNCRLAGGGARVFRNQDIHGVEGVEHGVGAFEDGAVGSGGKGALEVDFGGRCAFEVFKASEEAAEIEFFAEIHVGGTLRRVGKEAVERITLPDKAHTEPEDAEAFFEFLAGANGEDETGDDETPEASEIDNDQRFVINHEAHLRYLPREDSDYSMQGNLRNDGVNAAFIFVSVHVFHRERIRVQRGQIVR